MQHIESAIQQTHSAWESYKKTTREQRATFLREIAQQIEWLGDALLNTTHEETHLPLARLQGERARTLHQLKNFADIVQEGSWVEATIEKAMPTRTPMPKPDLRRELTPLGVVAVFGAANFPYAYSTMGGDSASALASGCTVVYKEHPAHPKTSQLVAQAVQLAIKKCNLPDGVFQHVSGGAEEGLFIVQHQHIQAVGFTGSLAGGKAIFDTACKRENPIPVYAEMSSVNPIFILPEKGKQADILPLIAKSITNDAGQFCTKPGLLFVQENNAKNFADGLVQQIEAMPIQDMLHGGMAQNYYHKLHLAQTQKNVSTLLSAKQHTRQGTPALAMVSIQEWLQNPTLQEEVFGPFSLLITYQTDAQLHDAVKQLRGQLTCSIFGLDDELEKRKEWLADVREKCGRLVFNGVPTGVEVCTAMTHGGPFPATTDSRSTSVGAYALKRFVRPITYQNMPHYLLPETLQNKNPQNIWRLIDSQWTKGEVV